MMREQFNLTAKQYNVLNCAITNKKNEDFFMGLLQVFGVDAKNHEPIYNQLLLMNKETKITELDKDFSGLQICAENNLNALITAGCSGDWKIDLTRASACGYLRVFSLNDRGLYFIAKIKGFERLRNGKYKILFENADLQRHESKNLKFNRNVVRYINLNDQLNKRKKK